MIKGKFGRNWYLYFPNWNLTTPLPDLRQESGQITIFETSLAQTWYVTSVLVPQCSFYGPTVSALHARSQGVLNVASFRTPWRSLHAVRSGSSWQQFSSSLLATQSVDLAWRVVSESMSDGWNTSSGRSNYGFRSLVVLSHSISRTLR